MPIIDAGYVNKQTAIEIRASLSNGWIRRQYSYMFDERCALDFSGDYKLRIHLIVSSAPLGPYQVLTDFPQEAACRGASQGVGYRLALGDLLITFQLTGDHGLNINLPWTLTRAGKAAVHWVENPIAEGLGARLAIELWVVFDPPPSRRPPDIRDWERRFFPGGLPTLGKRH